MAQSTDQNVPVEQQVTKLYELQLRDKASSVLYLNTKTFDVKFLFFEQNTADVAEKKLIEEVPAHKAILAAVSPVFDAEFFGSVKEKGDVEIVDSSPEAFKEFLKCFYFGTVTFTMKNIPEIMNLANKYDVADCMGACAKFLMDNLTSNDICWVYELAMLHVHQELKKFCDEFIISNASTVLKSEEFLASSQKLLREILILDLCCKETVVFDQCMAWAKNACQQSGINANVASNLRDQLGDCLYLIRFGLMTIQEFSEATLNCEGIFTLDEMGDIMRSISLKGFVSKKFHQNPRCYWDQSEVWVCKPAHWSHEKQIQEREIVFITSNRTTLLGRVFFAAVYSNSHHGILNAKVTIVEIQGQSFAAENGTILFQDTQSLSQNTTNYIKLPIPIVINRNNTYQLCCEFGNKNHSKYFYGCKLGEVTLKNGLIITFEKGSGHEHMIKRLEVIDN